MLKHDAMFFFAALIFLFIAWVLTGGPSRPISWAGPFLNAPAPLGNGDAYFLSGARFGASSSSSNGAGIKVGTSNGNSSAKSSADTVQVKNPSPFRGALYFTSSVPGATASDPNAEYLTVRAASTGRSPIDISGWQLVGDHARWNIPQGAASTNGGPSFISDIVLNPAEIATVISGNSPTGISFRDGGGWHIFLGSGSGLWGDSHDTIRLLDTQGRTVDVFTY